MRRFSAITLFAAACLPVAIAALAGSFWPRPDNPGGVWQGQPCIAGAVAPSSSAASRFLVLDTGGSGGGFGQGDVRDSLRDAFFWNEKLGWACGYGGVFKTEDGGLSWKRMKPRGDWQQLKMTGPEELWLLEGRHPGGPGMAWLWHSTDGGKTWREEAAGKLAGYWDLACRGDERWVICGGFPSFRSTDGGKTWRPENFGGLLHAAVKVALPGDMRTPEGYVVYAFGQYQQRPQLVKSTDSGHTWKAVALPEGIPFHIYAHMYFVTSQKGWISMADGKMLYTADGGQSWQWRNLPTDRPACALWFDQLGRGFAAVQNNDFFRFREALFETRDGGRSWTPVLSGAKQVNAIFALGPWQVWAVGDVPGFVPNDLVAILRAR